MEPRPTYLFCSSILVMPRSADWGDFAHVTGYWFMDSPLFPHVTVAIHHCGAVTMAATLRAGIPSITVPLGLDQSFWARRLEKLGSGTKPIPVQQLTADRLAATIQQASGDVRLRECAAHLGEKIRAEDDIGNAISIIEHVMARI